MRRAVDAVSIAPNLLLIDGTPAQPHPTVPATNIVDGDAFVCSIAAASILAKVSRDAILVQLDRQFPGYELVSNKGYGSAGHMVALRQQGATEAHRTSYAPVAKVLAAASAG